MTSASRARAPQLRCLWEPGLETKGLAPRQMLAIFFLHGLWEQLLIISDPETI